MYVVSECEYIARSIKMELKKKDYMEIAKIIKENTVNGFCNRNVLAYDLAEYFSLKYKDKFLENCGVVVKNGNE